MQGVIQVAGSQGRLGGLAPPEEPRLLRGRFRAPDGNAPHGQAVDDGCLGSGKRRRPPLEQHVQCCRRQQPQRHRRGIVGRQRPRHPGCIRFPRGLRIRGAHRLPQAVGQRLQADAARAQQHGRTARQVDDGGFHADHGWAAIQHQRHGTAQPAAHMSGAAGTDSAETVGRRRSQTGDAHRGQRLHQALENGVRRDAQRDGVLSRAGKGRSIGPAPEHQRERPRPEGIGQALCCRRPLGPLLRRLGIHHMHDQRMVGRTPLDAVDAGHRLFIGRVGGQPVDGLGGQADDATGLQYSHRFGQRSVGHRAIRHAVQPSTSGCAT